MGNNKDKSNPYDKMAFDDTDPKAALVTAMSKNKELGARIKSLEKELTNVGEERTALNEKLAKTEEEATALRARIEELEKKVKASDETLEPRKPTEDELAIYKSQIEDLKRRLAEAENQSAILTRLEKMLQIPQYELTQENDRLRNELDRLEEDYGRLFQKNQSTEAALEDLKLRYEALMPRRQVIMPGKPAQESPAVQPAVPDVVVAPVVSQKQEEALEKALSEIRQAVSEKLGEHLAASDPEAASEATSAALTRIRSLIESSEQTLSSLQKDIEKNKQLAADLSGVPRRPELKEGDNMFVYVAYRYPKYVLSCMMHSKWFLWFFWLVLLSFLSASVILNIQHKATVAELRTEVDALRPASEKYRIIRGLCAPGSEVNLTCRRLDVYFSDPDLYRAEIDSLTQRSRFSHETHNKK